MGHFMSDQEIEGHAKTQTTGKPVGTMERILADLRENGWRVAVHNDYRLDGRDMTFWLFTHKAGLFIQGEARTDLGALRICELQARKVFAPSP